MLERDSLKDLLNEKKLERLDKLLLILSCDECSPKAVSDIKAIGYASGQRPIGKWNISQILSTSKGLTARTDRGWELTSKGKTRVNDLVGGNVSVPTLNAATTLRALLSKVTNADTLSFLNEAVTCLESNLLRAAVVFTWVGAVSILQKHVFALHLSAFNTEASRIDQKWKIAKSEDDLSRMKEHDFLNVLEGISVIGKSVKQELQNCLTLRNGCGHPNSLKIGQHRVSAHIEILIQNIFQKFL